jgi:beta-lactamase superfamily II metal-dependent hydrolase
MSTIKSFAVGNGDMFYINHGTDNFTIIDCFLNNENTEIILDQIGPLSKGKGATRVISTHPDDDHIRGIESLDDKITIRNFYCVKNRAIKDDWTESFGRYCQLRDDPKKAFYIYKGCTRRWMNQSDKERGESGIKILWPDPKNQHFKDALALAEESGSPNNISAVIKYTLQNGVRALWLGDLETEFMRSIEAELDTSPVHILFAPHHGRETGRIPTSILEKLNPKIIVIGEANSQHLHYYPNYNLITQLSAGDVIFECVENKVHVFTSKEYAVDFHLDDDQMSLDGAFYVGTLSLT